MKKPVRKFVLIYIPGTDEEPVIEGNLTKEELDQRLKELQPCKEDYAIIQGNVIKGFS